MGARPDAIPNAAGGEGGHGAATPDVATLTYSDSRLYFKHLTSRQGFVQTWYLPTHCHCYCHLNLAADPQNDRRPMHNAVIKTWSVAKGMHLHVGITLCGHCQAKGKICREGTLAGQRPFSQETFVWLLLGPLSVQRSDGYLVPSPPNVRYYMQKVSVRMLNFAIDSHTNFCSMS
jgi:hypothetical protein